MKRRDYKEQVLRENYNNYIQSGSDDITFREYVERYADNDPNFFRWLFDDGELGDFDFGLRDEQIEEYREFIEEL